MEENKALLQALPSAALINEKAFRSYLTSVVYGDVTFKPAISELSPSVFEDLAFFVLHKAQFDLDATLFENFNQVLCTRKHKFPD